uniref:Cytosolic 5'-nucleotidase 1A-like n=1 Tax=Nothobranchius korthausae TaxID=1143690 RepID=A0A1A8FGM2_9TELE
MVSTRQDSDVTQKHQGHAVVVAITSRAVFDSDAGDDGGDVYSAGVAFPLLQALQRVNARLLEDNSAESLLFDVVLITTSSRQQQQSSRITNSTRHHGLEVGRFCFSSEEDFNESLLKHNVQLFLTTDENESLQATQQGVPSALLDESSRSCSSDQLRVLFCENAVIPPDPGPAPASRQAAQRLAAQLGTMRQKFGMFHSPLCFTLVMSRGSKESCCDALKALRSIGVSVDEAYCLAGAPRGPILSLLRPHFLLSEDISGLED